MTEQAITKRDVQIIRSYDEVERVAKAMAASGYFQDAKSISQAIVKIMAGKEIGFGPFASMQGVNIIKGNPTFNANMLASAVKASPKYDYRIVKLDDTICDILFYEDGKEAGHSTFTIQDAQKAGTSNLDKFPRNMLFARAMSNGVRWYCPDVTNGNNVYTPEELGANVDENGNIVDAESITVTGPGRIDAEPEQALPELYDSSADAEVAEAQVVKYDFKTRPYDPDTLRAALAKKADTIGTYTVTEKQRNFLGMLLNEYFQDDQKRHTVQLWLTGSSSVRDMDGAMVKAMLDWLAAKPTETGEYKIDSLSASELSHVLTAALLDEGQESLL